MEKTNKRLYLCNRNDVTTHNTNITYIKMKLQDFNDAIAILTVHHTNEIIINKPLPCGSVGESTSGSPTIHIKNCVHTVIKKLINAGFNVSMVDGLLSVNKY